MNALSILAPFMDAMKTKTWQAIFAAITLMWTIPATDAFDGKTTLKYTVILLVVGAVLETARAIAFIVKGVDHRGDLQRKAAEQVVAARMAPKTAVPPTAVLGAFLIFALPLLGAACAGPMSAESKALFQESNAITARSFKRNVDLAQRIDTAAVRSAWLAAIDTDFKSWQSATTALSNAYAAPPVVDMALVTALAQTIYEVRNNLPPTLPVPAPAPAPVAAPTPASPFQPTSPIPPPQ